MFNNLKLKTKNILLQQNLLPQQKSLKILTYHGVVEKITDPKLQRNFHTINTFKTHLNLLKSKGFKVISSSEIDEVLNTKEVKKTVWITFDDGYENNKIAMQILNDFKNPATFFISTATIDSDFSIWTVNISLLLLKGKLNSLDFNNKNYTLNTQEERLNAFQEIRQALKKCNAVQRNISFNQILNQFKNDELSRLIMENPYFKMLNWDAIKSLHNTGIDFQSHGHHHEIHHELQSDETIIEEITKSKQLIKNKLNKEITLFAYPNGNAEHKISKKILQEAGYKNAFILEQTYNSYPFQINRIDPNSKPEKFLRDLYIK